MKHTRWHVFIPETLEGEDNDYIRTVIVHILMSGLVLTGVLTILGMSSSWMYATPAAGIAFLVGAFLLWLMRRGHLTACRIIIPLFTFCLTTYLLAANEGLHDEGILLYPLTLILAGLVLGKHAVMLYTVLTVCAVTAIGYAEVSGRLVTPSSALTTPARVLAVDALLCFTAALLYFTINNLANSLQRSRSLHAETHEELVRRKQSEEALRKFERIVSATEDHIALVDRNYLYQVVNTAYLRSSSKAYNDIVGHSISTFLGTEVFERKIKPRFDRCLNGETIRYQAWFELETTGLQFMSMTYTPYREADGSISGVVVSARDITELKYAETQLLRLKKAVETTRLGITITDVEGKILYVNPAEAATHGYDVSELLGRNVGIFAPPDLRKPLTLDQFADEQQFIRQSLNIRKDGRVFPVHLISDIIRDAAGLPEATVTTCEDISERKQQEETLRQINTELNARIEELSTLNRITQTISSSLDLQEILDEMVQTMTELLHAQGSVIGLFNATATEMTILAHAVNRHVRKVSLEGVVLRADDFQDSFITHLFAQRQSLVIAHAQNHPQTTFLHDILRGRQVQGLLLVPLQARNHIIGLIVITTAEENRAFTPEDVALAETIAGQIAGIIENARLFEQERRQRQVAESLQEVALALNSSLDRELVLEKLLEQLGQVIQYDNADVFLREGSDLILSTGSSLAKNFLGTRLPISRDDPTSRVFRQQQPDIIADVRAEPTWTTWPGGEAIRGWIGAPLLVGQDPIGVLTLDSFEIGTYRPDDTRLLMAFANQAAVAIHNARLFDQMQRAQREALDAQKQAEAANTAKSRFLANMSHELRTPLHGILGNAQLLQHDTDLSAAQHEKIATIRDSGEQLLTLLNALLDISRLGPEQFQEAAASVEQLVSQEPKPSKVPAPTDDPARIHHIHAALVHVPADLRAQLEAAAIEGDAMTIDALIERMRPFSEHVADEFARLAYDFEYLEILTFLKSIKEDV